MHINNLSFAYGKKVIFNGASFSINNGLYYLEGPSGSGKSTLLYILHGLLPCKIKRPYTSSLMCQEIYTCSNYTVLNFLDLTSHRRDDAIAYLNLFNLDYTKKISQLSLGQKQIVAFIQSILKEADLYLLDEPFANVDAENRKKMLSVINELSDSKITIVASHIKINNALKIKICNHKILCENSDKSETFTKHNNKKMILYSILIVRCAILLLFTLTLSFISKNTDFNPVPTSNNELNTSDFYTADFQNIYDATIYGDNTIKDGIYINDVLHKKYSVKVGDYLQTLNGDKFIFLQVKTIINDDKINPCIYIKNKQKNTSKSSGLATNLAIINNQIKKMKFIAIFSVLSCLVISQIILSELFIKKYIFVAIIRGLSNVFKLIFIECVIAVPLLLFVPYGIYVIIFNFLAAFIQCFYMSKRFTKLLRKNI